MRKDDEMFEFQSGDDDLFTEAGEVVLVSAANLLDETMGAETFEHVGDLRGSFVR